ncbi:TetR/AcrR family transcriptional regulator [Edaphobacter albus]|uniref:TetR/AcrR family transcriptional regulator n=1 Tax=Edaphobacter sp. 4G125 TaxID=2763071 RepID=UPI00164667C8|nr:TetR/AcrR family transcriptional regulator [Edaphobacter sp. 4G125]QNI37261.1 TetR/AcrR family transcriptional regulator [Edaphobacter sp. 4G125]
MPRPASSSKQKVVTELRRSEILAAATKVFGNKGFDATLMDEIARTAGLAKGTLYLYFKSKDDIYQAVVRQALAELDELTRQHVNAVPDFAGKYAAFIRVRIAFWQEQYSLYRVILSMSRAPQYRKKSIGWQREAVLYLAELLEQGAAAGEVPQQDFLATAWTTMDAIRGVNERRVFSDSATRTVEEDTAFLTRFLLTAAGA